MGHEGSACFKGGKRYEDYQVDVRCVPERKPDKQGTAKEE